MYESPIEIIQKNTEMQMENGIYEAVTRVGIYVDKEELIKALNYDRGQYYKGYSDGFSDAYGITDNRILKVIKLIKHLLEAGETSIEIYMHSNDAIVITDGAVEKRHHIYFDDGETT